MEPARSDPAPAAGRPGRLVKCQSCGAPISLQREDHLVTCAYCGSSYILNRETGPALNPLTVKRILLAVRLPKEKLADAAREWMSRGFFKAADLDRKAVIGEAKGFVVPLWGVWMEAQVHWIGRNQQSRYGHRGTHRSVWNRVEGTENHTRCWPVSAAGPTRKLFGLAAITPGGPSLYPDWGGFFAGRGLGTLPSPGVDLMGRGKGVDLGADRQDFNLDAIPGFTILNGQVTRAEAELRAHEESVEFFRKECQGKADRITHVHSRIELQGSDLIFVPLWELPYTYRGKTYRILFDAHSGKILAGEHPVGKWDKVVVLMLIHGGLATACGVLAEWLEIPELWAGAAVLGATWLAYAAWTAVRPG
jgi:DNA-directed RNA polymerase subunit RPC12/RpoP